MLRAVKRGWFDCLERSFRMEYIDLFEVVAQVFTFVGTKDTQGETDQGPQMHYRVVAAVMLGQFMDLRMAVVTAGDAIVCAGRFNLIVFNLTVFQAFFFES